MSARIHITGELLVETNQGIVRGTDLPGRQGRLVLARLALTPHPVPREELADLVWADQLPRSWERDLSTVVSKIRSTLAAVGLDDAIASALGCYQLTIPRPQIDVLTAYSSVEQAERGLRADDLLTAHPAAEVAVNLARRPFLPGEEGPWVEARRAEWRRLLTRAIDALAEVLLRRSRLPEALRYAAEAVDLEPFRESGHVALMRVQLACGDRADALRTYERARTLLAEELGIPPSKLLEDAYLAALQADGSSIPVAGRSRPSRGLPTGTVTLMFTDLVASTELAETVGAEAFEELRRAHFRILRDAAATRRGHEVKNLGDGLMLAFGSAGDAVACAVDIQQSIDRANRRSQVPVAVRIGIHVGEPVVEDGDYFGLPVAVASRLCAAASGGEVLVSDVVRVLAGGDGASFGSARPVPLKGVTEPITASTVLWEAVDERALELPSAALVPADPSFAFVGRDAELAKLRSLVGSSRIALVTGEPGSGKTRVVAELASVAHVGGANVLWGRCEASGVGSYRSFVDALRPLVVTAPDRDLRRWVGSHASDLARLVPGLSDRFGGVPPALETAGEDDRARLFDAVDHLLTALASDRPTLLVIDDAHWIDDAGGLLLRHLAASAIPHLLIVVAYRQTELGRQHPLADLVGDLRRDRSVERVALPPLREQDIATLLGDSDMTLHPERLGLAHELMRLTDGNPFFVREVIRHLEESGLVDREDKVWRLAGGLRALGIPEGVREVVGRRLSRFDEHVNHALRTAAVIGREFDADILAAALGRPVDDVLELLELPLAAGLVLDAPGPADRFMFSHALVQETLAAELVASRRVRLHEQIGLAIEAARADRLDRVVEELAYHFVEGAPSGHVEEAVRYSERAATAALDQLAYESAEAHLRRALELAGDAGTRCRLLVKHAEVLRSLGDPAQRATALEAADLARSLDDNELLAAAALAAIDDWVLIGLASTSPNPNVIALLDDAAERAGMTPAGIRIRAYRATMMGLYDEDRDNEELAALARASGDTDTIFAALRVYFPPRDLDETENLYGELRALARERGHHLGLLGVELSSILTDVWTGELTKAAATIDDFTDLAERTRLRTYCWQPRVWRAALDVLQGRFDDAEARLATVADDLPDRIARYASLVASPTYFQIYRDRGMLDAIIDATEHTATRIGFTAFAASYAVALAETGHLEAAAEVYATVDHSPPLVAYHRPATWFTRTLAEHRLDLRDYADAGYAEGLEYTPWLVVAGPLSACYGSAHYGLGLLADLLERWDAADDHFQQARDQNAAIGARPWVAYAEHDHARSLLRRGRPADRGRARELGASALATAEALGMTRLVSDARATLAGSAKERA